MRAAPKVSPAPLGRKPEWTMDARVVLITRLFGGGAKTREVDKLSWLRSSAAKSALRAWWRAGNAHEFSSLEELRERESKLFGSAGTYDRDGNLRGGPGVVEVTTQSKLATSPSDYDESLSNPLNYALFPAQKMGQPAAKVAAPSDQSRAAIHLKSASKDKVDQEAILSGLRLWLVLGGAGARSRRGAGALAVSDPKAAKELALPVSLEDLEAFLRQHCERRQVAASLASIFCLARTRKLFLGPIRSSGEAAQKDLLAVLRGARQKAAGWPEADAIRLKSGLKGKGNGDLDPAKAGKYPKAALGLPIVMHFKAPPPSDHHIFGAIHDGNEWKKLERYSSPLILRPVRVWEGENVRYIPVAVFTDCTLPADARPLVTSSPKDPLKSSDVVANYSIAQEADATLQRIENAFAGTPGFRSL